MSQVLDIYGSSGMSWSYLELWENFMDPVTLEY